MEEAAGSRDLRGRAPRDACDRRHRRDRRSGAGGGEEAVQARRRRRAGCRRGLKPGGGTTKKEQFDRQLLAALLNFANGDPDFNELIDTNGNGTGDTPFLQVVAGAEAVRLDPASTDAQIEAQKNLLERINLEQA